MSGAAESTVEIRGLRKSFAGHLSLSRREVLRGLDLTVRRGEVYGFLGANGAGKTTTIKILAGLVFADEGTVRILGRPAPDTRSRERIGFLPEQPAFYGYLTAREFLEFQARLAGRPRADRAAEIDRLLEAVGMAERAMTPIRRCSKGMLQRLGLAQAMLGKPDLLILDEPMSGLDPAGRRDLRDLILGLRGRGATVFFSSHILSDAEALCDRVGILHGGRLAAEGSIDALLGNETPCWEVAVSGNVSEETLRLAGVRRGDRVLFRAEGRAELDTLLDRLRREGASLVSVTLRRASLEDRFLDVLRRPEGEG